MTNRKLTRAKYFFEDSEIEHLTEVPADGNQRMEETDASKVIGKPVSRVDGYNKVSGSALFTFDVNLPRMAHARTLRSPYPHAKIRRIDTSKAEALPGVLAVITHENTSEIPWYFDSFLFDPHLRYAGDEIACVAAETEAIAERALKLIDVGYEVLPFVVDTMKATEETSPVFHDEGRLALGEEITYERGDVEAGFANADVIVEDNYTTQSAVHNPTEPHCSVVKWDGDKLTVWDSTQAIYGVRDEVAERLGLPESHVQVISHYMGGGFGTKLETGKYTVMAALLARKIGRPVRIALTRKEMNLAVGNRPDSLQQLKIGVKNDGMLSAMTTTTYGAAGAYRHRAICYWPFMTMYQCDNVKLAAYSTYTNLGKARAFRAPGHPQGTFALDSILDDVAEKIGMDPLEFRLKNYAEIDQVSQRPYTSKKLREAYELGAAKIDWTRRRKTPGSDSGPVKRGLGMASQIWWGSGGPPAAVTVKLNNDGSVRVIAGTQDLGTGTYTILAQTVAEVLEIPVERIQVTIGDTAVGPYCPMSGGSMTAPTVTPAAQDAALQLKDALLSGAATMLEVSEENLIYKDGVVHAASGEKDPLGIAEIVQRLRERTLVRTGLRAANPEGFMIQSFGVQFAEVEVDTWTGKVRVVRIVAAHDIGRTLNRKLLENQFHGGIIMGMSYALFEERIVDESTGKVLNTNLHDYKIPTIADAPEIDVITVPHSDTKANSMGAKGCGEPPIIPTAAAIANAVYNAIGVRIKNLPITPDKVLNALNA